jgi:hypothetical protein
VQILRALPEPVTVDAGPSGAVAPASLSLPFLDGLISPAAEGPDFLRVGLALARDRVVEIGGELAEFLAPRLVGLAQVYRFAAWSAENDFVTSDEEFARSKAARDARRDEMDAEAARRRSEFVARQREQEAARKELEEQTRREVAARVAQQRRPRSGPAEGSEPVPDAPAGSRAAVRPLEHPRAPGRPLERPRRAPERKQPATAPAASVPSEPIPVEVGHRVRVVKGPLAGQLGTVQDIDARGCARVLVGVLASRLPLDDLVGLGPLPEGSQGRKRR